MAPTSKNKCCNILGILHTHKEGQAKSATRHKTTKKFLSVTHNKIYTCKYNLVR